MDSNIVRERRNDGGDMTEMVKTAQKQLKWTKSKKPLKWLGGAIKHPGAFTNYVHEKYGSKAFTERGTLKVEYVNKVIKDPKATTVQKRRARLAKTLRKIGKK